MPIKKAVFTVWFNDLVILDVWLKYYSKHFDKLVVINDQTKDIYLPEIEKRKKQYNLEFIRGEEMMNVERANNKIEQVQSELLKDYEWVLFTNCDEIVVPDPKYTFDRLIEEKNQDYISCEAYEVIEVGESPIDFTQALLKQRTYWLKNPSMNKTLLSRIPLKWREGQHSLLGTEAEDSKEIADTGLYLIHLRHFNLSSELNNPRDFGPFFHSPHHNVLELSAKNKTLMPEWVKEVV